MRRDIEVYIIKIIFRLLQFWITATSKPLKQEIRQSNIAYADRLMFGGAKTYGWWDLLLLVIGELDKDYLVLKPMIVPIVTSYVQIYLHSIQSSDAIF